MCNKNFLGNINGYTLDEQQLNAAICESKYSIIIAGAGSGKSTTMIGKIKYLVEFKGVKPKEILCISFTNEATKNLKQNILKNCGIDIDVKTFHKLALKILEDNHLDFILAPPNYLNFIVDEFLLTQDNFVAINNIINFIKNKFHLSSWTEYLKITKTNEFMAFKKLIIKFLNLYFAKYNSIDMLKHFFAISKRNKDKTFLKLIIAIYRTYEIEKQAQGFIDFDDMINLATKTIIEGGMVSNYKYIIIDEFQDTSLIRFDLIKAIIDRNDSYLTVVGDDFQSIYRFSGCNLDIFINFKKHFNDTKILKIENTYRNSQELIDIAGKFVTRNPIQIKKNLKSNKRLQKPIKLIFEKQNSLKDLLYNFEKTKYNTILILGRNNFDINKYIDNELIVEKDGFITLLNSNKKIRFLTVHKSKGLEADVVIILNMVNNVFGFPNQLEDHKIIKLLNNYDTFPYEEERRLFYVALTRTKNEVYLLTEKNNSSIFIKELLKYYKKYIEIIDQN